MSEGRFPGTWILDKLAAALTLTFAVLFFFIGMLSTGLVWLQTIPHLNEGPQPLDVPPFDVNRILMRAFAPPVAVLALFCLGGVGIYRGERTGWMAVLLGSLVGTFTGCGWGQLNLFGLSLLGHGIGSGCCAIISL